MKNAVDGVNLRKVERDRIGITVDGPEPGRPRSKPSGALLAAMTSSTAMNIPNTDFPRISFASQPI